MKDFKMKQINFFILANRKIAIRHKFKKHGFVDFYKRQKNRYKKL